jgi:hypothetical protein
VSDQEGPPCRPLTSNFKPQTSHFPPDLCKTRCPRQKSPSRASAGVFGRISKADSADSDFCRGRQTKPNLGGLGDMEKGRCQVSSLKFRMSGWRSTACRPLTSNFTLQTSHSLAFKTNPISPARPEMGAGWPEAMAGRRAIVQNEPNLPRPEAGTRDKCAKRTQFRPAGPDTGE